MNCQDNYHCANRFKTAKKTVKDRDEKGRFVEGNPGNPQAKGRPKKAREQRYYEIAMSAISFGDWKAIIQRAGKQAKAGDAAARRFLADYLLGKPQQSMDLTSGGEALTLPDIVFRGVDPGEYEEREQD